MVAHGSARWAGWDELRAHGLLGARNGLLVGFAHPTESGCEPIRYGGDLHQLIVGGTGGGKFTTALAPMLLGSGLERQTVVVVDPKGEIARLTGPVFQRPFAQAPSIFLLDPWDQCGTGRSSALNVLDAINTSNPNYVDDARALADAMIIPSGAENTHWDNAARNFLTAIILFVALDPSEEGHRDLIRVRDLVTLSWAMPKAYKGPKRETLSALLMEHLVSDLAGGAVRRGFSSLMNREDKERSGILSSIERDTAWIDSPQMQRVLQGASLDLSRLADAGNKYYVVLPPDYFMTHRAWLRLMVTAFAKAMKRHRARQDGPQHARWRHIVVDEFANLGEMSFVQEDVAVARGFDVKYHFAIQDLSQLKRVYKDGWESFINNSFQRFFAVGDLFTARYVSDMLGASTVDAISSSRGSNTGDSWADARGETVNRGTNFGALFSPATHSGGTGTSATHTETVTRGTTASTSLSQIQRPLYTPDEVRRLPADRQILFFRGMHPVWSWRPPYWQIFPSLPRFTLAAVLGTVGRQPQNLAELGDFTNWRRRGSLMRLPSGSRQSWLPRLALLPALVRFAVKASTFVLVTGGLSYGAFSLLFDRPTKPAPDRVVLQQPVAPPQPAPAPQAAPATTLAPKWVRAPDIKGRRNCHREVATGTIECEMIFEPVPPRADNPANVSSGVNPLADRPIAIAPPPAAVPPPPAAPRDARLSDQQRRAMGAALRSLIASDIVSNVSDMSRARGADDRFVQAIGRYNAPRHDFILRLATNASLRGGIAELAIVCGLDGKIFWIVDLRQLDGTVGQGLPIIYVKESRPPGKRPNISLDTWGDRVLITDKLAPTASQTIIARVREYPLAERDGDATDLLDRAEFKNDASVQLRTEFCNLQGELAKE